ncbi:unnamed protein product [Schistosoma margrebowiei]|uniref:Uncharacterized protein n=1 Tax=Schistosoma margrebowiei TaxID=48269 RepID=A0A183MRI9_9TREM|nr:unnamed protein product [Schistosoma margrebowiei]
MNLIQCYAPTYGSNDDNNDRFYESVLSVIAKYPLKDLTTLMGDLNAEVVKWTTPDMKISWDDMEMKMRGDWQIYVHSINWL